MTLRDGALHVRRRKYGERPLVDVGDGLFIGPQRIRFERSESGAVAGFRVFTDRVRGLWFEREDALEP